MRPIKIFTFDQVCFDPAWSYELLHLNFNWDHSKLFNCDKWGEYTRTYVTLCIDIHNEKKIWLYELFESIKFKLLFGLLTGKGTGVGLDEFMKYEHKDSLVVKKVSVSSYIHQTVHWRGYKGKEKIRAVWLIKCLFVVITVFEFAILIS